MVQGFHPAQQPGKFGCSAQPSAMATESFLYVPGLEAGANLNRWLSGSSKGVQRCLQRWLPFRLPPSQCLWLVLLGLHLPQALARAELIVLP